MELRRLPIIKLWDRIVVPIQGEITDELAGQLSQEILREIHQSGAHGLVLDLTGVWIMDSHLCSVLSNLASAARLMGTAERDRPRSAHSGDTDRGPVHLSAVRRRHLPRSRPFGREPRHAGQAEDLAARGDRGRPHRRRHRRRRDRPGQQQQ